MQIKFPTKESAVPFSLKELLWKQKERVFTVVALLFLGSALLAKGVYGKERRFNDYFQAGVFQAKLKAGKEIDDQALSKLLKKHADLKPLFSHHLHQSAILKGDIKQAKFFSADSLKRLSFMGALYQEFARTSLLIEEKKYEEALIRSKLISEQLKKENSPNLFGLNAVRIAFLESLLKSPEVSLDKWVSVKDQLSNELYTHLTDEELTLLDFVKNLR